MVGVALILPLQYYSFQLQRFTGLVYWFGMYKSIKHQKMKTWEPGLKIPKYHFKQSADDEDRNRNINRLIRSR